MQLPNRREINLLLGMAMEYISKLFKKLRKSDGVKNFVIVCTEVVNNNQYSYNGTVEQRG